MYYPYNSMKRTGFVFALILAASPPFVLADGMYQSPESLIDSILEEKYGDDFI